MSQFGLMFQPINRSYLLNKNIQTLYKFYIIGREVNYFCEKIWVISFNYFDPLCLK